MTNYAFVFTCKYCRKLIFTLNDNDFAINNNNGIIVKYMVQKPKLINSVVFLFGGIRCIRCRTKIGRHSIIPNYVIISAEYLKRIVVEEEEQ